MTHNSEQRLKVSNFVPHCTILFVVDAIMCFVSGVKEELVPPLVKIDF